ncbi:unnamed protein product [Prorocentrum cordatum]|uniref:Uncharacterized protein n=1 Tax=Prorocentrum cordatum TaxID=2364126 RepID=A0ABN9SXC4_9DINO|nr:unnamed protein product [Polarella glacialis]
MPADPLPEVFPVQELEYGMALESSLEPAGGVKLAAGQDLEDGVQRAVGMKPLRHSASRAAGSVGDGTTYGGSLRAECKGFGGSKDVGGDRRHDGWGGFDGGGEGFGLVDSVPASEFFFRAVLDGQLVEFLAPWLVARRTSLLKSFEEVVLRPAQWVARVIECVLAAARRGEASSGKAARQGIGRDDETLRGAHLPCSSEPLARGCTDCLGGAVDLSGGRSAEAEASFAPSTVLREVLNLFTVAIVFGVTSPNKIHWVEALILLSEYVAYCSFMKVNGQVEDWIKDKLKGVRGTPTPAVIEVAKEAKDLAVAAKLAALEASLSSSSSMDDKITKLQESAITKEEATTIVEKLKKELVGICSTGNGGKPQQGYENTDHKDSLTVVIGNVPEADTIDKAKEWINQRCQSVGWPIPFEAYHKGDIYNKIAFVKCPSVSYRDALIREIRKSVAGSTGQPWANIDLPFGKRTAENALFAFKHMLVDWGYGKKEVEVDKDRQILQAAGKTLSRLWCTSSFQSSSGAMATGSIGRLCGSLQNLVH